MTESIELKNCPCCNGVVIWCDSIPDEDGDNHECDHLICNKCGLDFTLTNWQTDNCETILDMKKCVTERFNTRADGWISVDISPDGDECIAVDLWLSSGKRLADCMYLSGLGIYMHHTGRVDNATYWMLPPSPPKAK